MYEQITRNQRDSWILMSIVVALMAALGCAIALAEGLWWAHGAVAAAALGIGACAYALYGGSDLVLGLSHALPIDKPDNPRLFNVVEEMAIASGLPMPRVYIIPDPSPNAFAAGRQPETAAVVITTGLLEKLNRDELQGVIAHEMAHIRNRDTRLLILLAILVGGVTLISDAFIRMRRTGLRRSSSRVPAQLQIIAVLLALILALLAPLFARLLELAVSRRREYLADASAALITRYPDGLASALEKIADDPSPLASANRATQHLFIVNPLKTAERRTRSLFDTHPDIRDRIRRLREMGFKEEPSEPAAREPGYARMARAAEAEAPGTSGGMGAPLVATAAGGAPVAKTDERSDEPVCPRCRAGMLKGRIRGREILGCRQCGGVWLGEQAVHDLLTEAPDDLDAADRRFPNLVGAGWDRLAGRLCPRCGGSLEPHMPPSPVRVALDRCPQGHGLWFDDGELSALAWAAKRR